MKTAFFLFDLAENTEREQQARLYEISYYVSRKLHHTFLELQCLQNSTILMFQDIQLIQNSPNRNVHVEFFHVLM